MTTADRVLSVVFAVLLAFLGGLVFGGWVRGRSADAGWREARECRAQLAAVECARLEWRASQDVGLMHYDLFYSGSIDAGWPEPAIGVRYAE